MQEFFVGNYRVDILRNQIVCEGEVIALEPKILEVLKVLAEHHGEVVSHQTLLDEVWPDMVVAPNALQRCIGQLRKALGDDGKKQSVIVTHPKKGYSLVAQVSVREKTESRAGELQIPDKATQDGKPDYKAGMFAGITAAILVGVFLWFMVFSEDDPTTSKPPLSQFEQLTPLTATDTSEFYSTFSPDGRYVAFSRNVGGNKGHMWLKDLTTNREIQITKFPGRYGQPNWSTDGKQMAFLDLAACKQDCQQRCESINTLYVPLALSEPQEMDVLAACDDIPLQGLQWVSEKAVAFIRNQGDHGEIIVKDAITGEERSLYKSQNSIIYSLAYSSQNETLAVMQESPELEQSLMLVSVKNGSAELTPFSHPARYNTTFRWYPIWNATGDKLLFSAETRLYLMDLEGNLQSQVIPTFQDISRPMFHPDGSSIAMTLGKVDRDIAELELGDYADTETGNITKYREHTLARSILRETVAKYHPDGETVAFFSQRDGSRELWLSDKTGVRQLSQLAETAYPEYFAWSPNGKQIAVMTEKQLYLFDLQGNVETIKLHFRATKLYQWNRDDTLLMSMIDEQGMKLIAFDLKTRQHLIRHMGYVRWAQQYTDTVIFSDQNNKLNAATGTRVFAVDPLADVTTWSRFVVRHEQLYILTSDDDVLRFDLEEQTLENLFHYPNTTVALTDVSPDHQHFLISKQISAKKEIVLLEQGDSQLRAND